MSVPSIGKFADQGSLQAILAQPRWTGDRGRLPQNHVASPTYMAAVFYSRSCFFRVGRSSGDVAPGSSTLPSASRRRNTG